MDTSPHGNKNTSPRLIDTSDETLTPTEAWLVSRLNKHGFAYLTELVEAYIRFRDPVTSPGAARHYLYRVLRHLEAKGVITLEHDDHHLLVARLKRLPLNYRKILKTFRIFDLSHASRRAVNLFLARKIRAVPSDLENLRIKFWKYHEIASIYRRLEAPRTLVLEKLRGLIRIQHRLSEEKFAALKEISGMKMIIEDSTVHHDLNFLFEKYEKRMKNSITILYDEENDEFIALKPKSRFIDPKLLKHQYNRAEHGLKKAFKKYRNAVFLTLTVPRILPLSLWDPDLQAFLLLQDSALAHVLRGLKDFIRNHWKGRPVKFFTAYEYHDDGALHIHLLIFGIPYILDWNRPTGKNKIPALEYYAKKFHIDITGLSPTKASKMILTAILDDKFTKYLEKVDAVLGTHYLHAYQSYKEEKGLQGIINEVHRIKDGKWAGAKPKDSKGPDAVKYVLKYLLKAIREFQYRALGLSKDPLSLKLLGYWIFSKRFYSASPELLPSPPPRPEWVSRYRYIGTWPLTDLPDYIYEHLDLL